MLEKIIAENKYIPRNEKKIIRKKIERLIKEYKLSEWGAKHLATSAWYDEMVGMVYWTPQQVADATELYTATYIQKMCLDRKIFVRRGIFSYEIPIETIEDLYERKNKRK